jgi:hypothetical protein
MIEIGRGGGGDFGAFIVLDGVEEAAAGWAVGILVADFDFVAGFDFEAEEAADGFADGDPVNLERSGGGLLLRERPASARCGERAGVCDEGDEPEGEDSRLHVVATPGMKYSGGG